VWLIFTMCFLIVLLDGFDTAAIGYIAPSLIQEWGVSKPALAPVLSAALFGLAGGARCSLQAESGVRRSAPSARHHGSLCRRVRWPIVWGADWF
jgi:hypothetical protein